MTLAWKHCRRVVGSSQLRSKRLSSSGDGRRRAVVVGAGVAGSSAAMHLVRRGVDVTLVDARPPLTATSQYSTECYRNFFLDPALVPFMSRSLELMEELTGEENKLNLQQRGYCFLAESEQGRDSLEEFATVASGFGAGPVRRHHSSDNYERSQPRGCERDFFARAGLHQDVHMYGFMSVRMFIPVCTLRLWAHCMYMCIHLHIHLHMLVKR